MTATQAPPKVKPRSTDPERDQRFAKLRTQYLRGLERARRALENAATDRQVAVANIEINGYSLALENLDDAELIEPGHGMVQFGTQSASTFQAHLPLHFIPRHEHEQEHLCWGFNYRVMTDDPLKIAWLRRIVREGKVEGLREMKPGLVAAFSQQTHQFIEWMDSKQYQTFLAAKAVRNW